MLSYHNPVWPEYFADPFILRWRGEYYAYGTGGAQDNPERGDRPSTIFPVLHSTDLVHWTRLAGALAPPRPTADDEAYTVFWAPEVAERDGQFFMYYSAAYGPGDETHRIRVAIADHPAGPFRDLGRLLLPNEQFTIDAHPFRDPKDGAWYLFFAKDFFDERVGTGIAAVRLGDDMQHVVGPVTTVLRAAFDWQVYERNRQIYGQTWDAWHTVEGPFVVVHNGQYYCFYSGGAWHTEAYGISYGVADHVLGPYHDEWSQHGPTVLRGTPAAVRGAGHNSVVLGPDEHTEFIVYHAWDQAQTARRMFIDPLIWTPEGPRSPGPSEGWQTIEGPGEPQP